MSFFKRQLIKITAQWYYFLTDTNYRSRNIIWSLEEYLPINDVDSDRIIFHGARPPTVKDVFMNFKGQHAKLQEEIKC